MMSKFLERGGDTHLLRLGSSSRPANRTYVEFRLAGIGEPVDRPCRGLKLVRQDREMIIATDLQVWLEAMQG